MKRITLEEIMEVQEITCARCGGSATVYPYPLGKGTCFCPVCSPKWVADYLQFAIERASHV